MKPTEDKNSTDQFWQLALAVNAAFKGLLGSTGQSGHICARTLFACKELNLLEGWDSLMKQLIKVIPQETTNGDVIVIPDKIVAISLNRIGPRAVISDLDPKTVDSAKRALLAKQWSNKLGFPIESYHLLLADEYGKDQVSIGCDDHNQRCFDLANKINEELGLKVDVIISDTDTGLDVRQPLIGTVTIAATPLGATGGVNIYEAMRCAVAAEFVRGHTRFIPVVICVPAERRKLRENIGKKREYPGMLDANKEPFIAHA